MDIQSNRYYIDSMDLWVHFKVGVESGSDDFLKMPKRKESITRNWQDENGIEVDTSRPFFEAKEIELKCHIIADNEQDFWENYYRFLNILKKPGYRRISVIELQRNFYVIYKDCTVYKRFTRLLSINKVACKFVLKLQEGLIATGMELDTYIVDEQNRFIVT